MKILNYFYFPAVQHQVQNKTIIIILLAAIVGLADSVFLAVEHIMGVVPPCTIKGCDYVLTSQYASVGPIPTALFGVLYYLAILLLIAWFVDRRNAKSIVLLKKLVAIGAIITIGLIILQWLVIQAWCQYCLLSVLCTFVIAFVIFRTPAGGQESPESH